MIMKRVISFLVLCIVMQLAWADLNGIYEDNGDGTYTVEVVEPNGHRYEGLACPQCNCTMQMEIHDHNESSYSGTGIYQGRGAYGVSFQNDNTGHRVPGRIIPE